MRTPLPDSRLPGPASACGTGQIKARPEQQIAGNGDTNTAHLLHCVKGCRVNNEPAAAMVRQLRRIGSDAASLTGSPLARLCEQFFGDAVLGCVTQPKTQQHTVELDPGQCQLAFAIDLDLHATIRIIVEHESPPPRRAR